MLKFRLPVAPPLNNAYANVRGRGRTKTARHRAWVRDADAYYVTQGLGHAEKITVPYVCRMIFPRSLRGDLDGRAKHILDWMVSRNLTIDDRYCWGLYLDKEVGDLGGIVRIEVLPHAGSTQLKSGKRVRC